MLKKAVVILFACVLILFSCAGQGAVLKGAMPAWVNDAYSAYPKSQYVAATGFGPNRTAAEANALSALTSFFGQTVEIDRSAASSYRQAIINGVMEGWADTAEMKTNLRTTSSMDNLMGAEIKEVWFDSKDTYYAVAVMEKAKGIQIYGDLMKVNQNIISNLVTMTPAEKNTMEGVLRFRFAAVVSDINVTYRNIIVLLGRRADNAAAGDFYRLEAQNIIKLIPVHIRITNDRNGRLFSAFAKCFTDWGFETVSTAAPASLPRYALDVNLALSPVTLPGNQNVFSRIELTANFTDTSNNQVLFPYSFISREGHTTQAEADNRCILAAERNIGEQFAALLSDYLTQLKPKK